MRATSWCVVLLLIVVTPAGQAVAALPAGNPINATIPAASWSIELEDVLTIPNSGGQIPRLEFLTSGGAPGLAYVIDQHGKVYSFDPGASTPSPSLFLDLSSAVQYFTDGAQTGVRGLAFHPDFNNPGTDGYRKFYTSHSVTAFAPGFGSPGPVFYPSPPNLNHDSAVGEWTMNANGTVNTSSYREVVRVGQPFDDHNIGQIGFNPNATTEDPDYGNLYVALGDGGNNFPPIPIDPNDLAQDLDWPHGSILRIDPLVSGSTPYSIPSDNPYRVDNDLDDAHNLIWAYGMRNPHRFTFDTGGDQKMLISDIGQSNIEEINLGAAGANYGWDLREGTFQTTGTFSGSNNIVDTLPGGHPTDAFTYPVAQYDHDPDNNNNIEGLWAIVGSSVYRGTAVPQLTGLFLFADFAQNYGPFYAVDVDDLVQREDFSNLSSLDDGFLAPFVEVPLMHDGQQKTMLQIIRDASGNQGLNRTDTRFGLGPDGEIYVLNKHDGVVRKITAVTDMLVGDYNSNGVVDAADYAVWRDHLGTAYDLPNDPTPGYVTQSDYDRWRANFGMSNLGSGSANPSQQEATVPEPASWLLAVLALAAMTACRTRKVMSL